MENQDRETNWGQSVTGVLIKDNKVLLARHTYGAGKNLLIVPGGYVYKGETPQAAVVREYLEETGILIEPKEVIAIRFNQKDWYVAFKAEYISGTAVSDYDENSEVLWIDTNKALARADVPDLTKKLIEAAINNNAGLRFTNYKSNADNGTYSLFAK